MKNINVFEDDNANFCYIVGTKDPKEAEAALREQENLWFGDDESKWDGEIEKRMDFNEFYPVTFYIRGQYIVTVKEEIPISKGRIAEREGFLASLD